MCCFSRPADWQGTCLYFTSAAARSYCTIRWQTRQPSHCRVGDRLQLVQVEAAHLGPTPAGRSKELNAHWRCENTYFWKKQKGTLMVPLQAAVISRLWEESSAKQVTSSSPCACNMWSLLLPASTSHVHTDESPWPVTSSLRVGLYRAQEGRAAVAAAASWNPSTSHLLLLSTQPVGAEPDHLCSQPLNGPAGRGRGLAAGRGSCRVPGSERAVGRGTAGGRFSDSDGWKCPKSWVPCKNKSFNLFNQLVVVLIFIAPYTKIANWH